MSMSVGLSVSATLVIELTVVPPSLMSSVAMCECSSMMPGETNLPVRVHDWAPGGTWTSAPTAAILPSRTSTVPFGMVPWVTVRTVAPRIAKVAPGRAAWPAARGAQGGERRQ